MTTLKIDIQNEQDVITIREILGKFKISYQIEKEPALTGKSLEIYEGLKEALQQVQLHEKGEIKLKTLKESLTELNNEL